MVPVAPAVTQLLPVVVIEKPNGEPTVVVGLPLIVNTVPATLDVTPAGKPVTVAPVEPPPRS